MYLHRATRRRAAHRRAAHRRATRRRAAALPSRAARMDETTKKTHLKKAYSELRKKHTEFSTLYKTTKDPKLKTTLATTRAQIEIYAAAHNRNRALYDKGVANWEDAIKNQFELIEEKQVVMIHATDGKKVEMSKPDSERPPDSRTYKNDQVLNDEEAVYSIGEYIKKKRNLYNIDLPAFVGKTWWK